MYQKENKKAFKFIDFCNCMKDNQKWEKSKTFYEYIDSGSKCSRTSKSEYTTLDACIRINLNDDENVKVTPLSRSMRRDKENHKDKGKRIDLDDLKVIGDEVKVLNERL